MKKIESRASLSTKLKYISQEEQKEILEKLTYYHSKVISKNIIW